jgi:hypothetical protein
MVAETIAGGPFISNIDGAVTDGPGASAKFFNIRSMAADALGNLYLTEERSPRLRYIQNPAGPLTNITVSTVAGGLQSGVLLGPLPARLNGVSAVAMYGGKPYFFSENSILHLE